MVKNFLSIDCDWIQSTQQMVNLNDLIFNRFKSAKRIIFSKNHHAIIKYIDKPINLYNIDHHHDINYHYENQYVNQGNWIQYLNQKNLLEKYFWVHNSDSEMIHDEITDFTRPLKGFDYNMGLELCDGIEFEDILICESFGFTDYLKNEAKKFFIPYYIFKQIAVHFFEEKVIIDNEENKVKFYGE
tara:strand:- start:471 stop:1028 length:558 start_codon:yes stop_codon:yes gene_type:complete